MIHEPVFLARLNPVELQPCQQPREDQRRHKGNDRIQAGTLLDGQVVQYLIACEQQAQITQRHIRQQWVFQQGQHRHIMTDQRQCRVERKAERDQVQPLPLAHAAMQPLPQGHGQHHRQIEVQVPEAVSDLHPEDLPQQDIQPDTPGPQPPMGPAIVQEIHIRGRQQRQQHPHHPGQHLLPAVLPAQHQAAGDHHIHRHGQFAHIVPQDGQMPRYLRGVAGLEHIAVGVVHDHQKGRDDPQSFQPEDAVLFRLGSRAHWAASGLASNCPSARIASTTSQLSRHISTRFITPPSCRLKNGTCTRYCA